MPGSRIAAQIALVLWVALLAASSASSADLDPLPDLAPRPELSRNFGIDRMCQTETIEVAVYPPAPRYVYDNRRGPTWTGNGWAYLPVGEYPNEDAPRLVPPPPPHGVSPAEFLEIPCRILEHLQHLPDYLPGR